MNQCVPVCDMDDNPKYSNSFATDVYGFHNEVEELIWENGLPATKYLGDKPGSGGTLESIVNQATGHSHGSAAVDELMPWFDHHSAATTMDAQVPCAASGHQSGSNHVPGLVGTPVAGGSARVGSCGGVNTCLPVGEERRGTGVARELSIRDNGVGTKETRGAESQWRTQDTWEREPETCGFTSASTGLREQASSGKPSTKAGAPDDHVSTCQGGPQNEVGQGQDKSKALGKCSISTKRSRAAAVHNQSERRRRDKINQRIRTLQKMVPNSNKTDKASVLDDVIDYLKQLQAQVQKMSRTSVMLPILLLRQQQQQQLQLSSMAQMGMGIVDPTTVAHPNIAGMPLVLNSAAFQLPPVSPLGGAGDRLPGGPRLVPDHMSAFLACQSQPMNMDAYSRMVALYQEFLQSPPQNGPRNYLIRFITQILVCVRACVRVCVHLNSSEYSRQKIYRKLYLS